MKTSANYTLIILYADVPYFSSRFTMRETFHRMMANELGLMYSLRITVWFAFRSLRKGYIQKF